MGLPRRVGARVRPCFESKRRAQQKRSGLRGEARADVADELERRGGVGMRRPVDAVLQDQVLLGERLGLAVIPRRAERVRDVVREAQSTSRRNLDIAGQN